MYITSKRPKDLQVEVLGTVYKIVFKTPEEDVRLLECDGYCDNSINQITIKWFTWDSMNYNDMLIYTTKCIRHEVIHAFLYQSGLDVNSLNAWARNEEMVDWLAIQLYKINEAAFNIDQEFYKNNKKNIIIEP